MTASLKRHNSNKLSHITNTSCPNIQSTPQISLTPSGLSVIGVHMKKNKLKIKVGQSAELSAFVLPVQATNQELIWTNMNPSIAVMISNKDKIIITGKSPGRAIIIVTTNEGRFRDLCIVHVHPFLTNPK
ncbi:Ig-like domain-containing protein [Bacillus sp. C1]